jgi:hypothetical protein
MTVINLSPELTTFEPKPLTHEARVNMNSDS